VPEKNRSAFAACPSGDGSLCVPDAIISAGVHFQPKACVFALDKSPGVCLSLCVDKVGSDPNAKLLTQETCANGDVCVPCTNPLTKMPTGACDIKGEPCGAGPSSTSSSSTTGGGPTCPYDGPPLVDPKSFPACACAGSHCVPSALVPKDQQAKLLTCDGGFCVPDETIASKGLGVPKTCTSIGGAEGRCLSTCLPVIAKRASLLPTDVCGAGQVCAPCYDPTASDPNAPTGACEVACDKPAKPPVKLSCPHKGPPIVDPKKFEACTGACGGARCLPADMVPASQQSKLAGCKTKGNPGFCVMDETIASAQNYVPPTCKSIAGAEGRCLSTCLPEIAAQGDLLPQDSCAAGYRCAPCFNPTAKDPLAPTGACSLASCDMPAEPPLKLTCPWKGAPVVNPSSLDSCNPVCGSAHCMPAGLVPAAQQSQLNKCTADGGAGFCLPDAVIAAGGNYVPPSCDPFPGSGAEGRCLSKCLPAVAAKKGELVQSSCSSSDLCVPCSDPFTGQSTGACTTSCDKPSKPVFTFPKCCVNATCIPKGKISADTSKLNLSNCPANGANYLCVPNEYVPQTKVPVSTCSTWVGKGTCVSECIDITASWLFSQNQCPGHHKCVPCLVAGDAPGCG
jgi:hypothetical protein